MKKYKKDRLTKVVNISDRLPVLSRIDEIAAISRQMRGEGSDPYILSDQLLGSAIALLQQIARDATESAEKLQSYSYHLKGVSGRRTKEAISRETYDFLSNSIQSLHKQLSEISNRWRRKFFEEVLSNGSRMGLGRRTSPQNSNKTKATGNGGKSRK